MTLLEDGAGPARSLQVARADGVAAGLEACLRSSNVDTAFAACGAIYGIVQDSEAMRALLHGAPGVVDLAAARLAACAPRAAAREAGVDAGAGRGFPGHAALCEPLIDVLISVARHSCLLAPGPLVPQLAPLLRLLVPTLVALFVHPDAEAACVAARHAAAAAFSHPLAASRLFRLGGRGVLPAVEARLSLAARELSGGGALSGRAQAATDDAMTAAGITSEACRTVLTTELKLLTTPAAEAWATAAPRLLPRLASVQRSFEQAAAAGGGDFSTWRWPDGRPFSFADIASVHASATRALRVLSAWVPRARRIAETARSSGAAGPGGCSSGGGSGAALQRCCAACGRSRAADGARLRRCRGCGAFTGVMYCGDACAREHWVRRGHRRVCEPASAQLEALELEVDALKEARRNT